MADAAQNIAQFPEKSRYKAETAQPWLDLYRSSGALQNGPDWLQNLRSDAEAAFKESGIPTPRLERWKYTNLIPLTRELAKTLDPEPLGLNTPVDNLVDNLGDILSNPPEWLKEILASKDEATFRYQDMMLCNLADLFLQNGLVIDVPAGQVLEVPIEIDQIGKAGTFASPRIVIRLGEGAEVTVLERHSGQGAYWHNNLTQIHIGQNAKLRHYRIQDHSADSVYTQTTLVELSRDASYEGFTLTKGAALSRNQVHAVINGTNANCDISGINLLRGRQHGDTTVEVEHRVSHGTSSQFMRSVLDDQAHGIFLGKVFVERDAQQTDGTQMSNALLLSEGAEMDTRPELEIYADDVKCAHGATTGQLEDEPMFYLRSRGLAEDEARTLLIGAFIGEVVEKLGDEALRDTMENVVREWLSGKA